MLSIDETFHKLQHLVGKQGPEAELYLKAELIVEIEQLKKEHNAVILGHNYMEAALFHTVCDYKGDSLELARVSRTSKADLLVFCGVGFMAETAKILSPEKTVLLPDKEIGCSLASSITAKDVRELKKLYPGVPVVTYVNTSAAVKAETDICCTSGNAAKVLNSLSSKEILFLPDEYLAKNLARETGKKLIFSSLSKKTPSHNENDHTDSLISWHGKCVVHDRFSTQDIAEVRSSYPNVCILAHPECKAEVCEAADFSGSTAAMIKFVKDNDHEQFLLLTECSMADNILAENPNKNILRLCSMRCPFMAQITLETTRDALLHLRYKIEIPEDIRIKAKESLDRMLAIA